MRLSEADTYFEDETVTDEAPELSNDLRLARGTRISSLISRFAFDDYLIKVTGPIFIAARPVAWEDDMTRIWSTTSATPSTRLSGT